jgi:hypothetical protein
MAFEYQSSQDANNANHWAVCALSFAMRHSDAMRHSETGARIKTPGNTSPWRDG